MKKCVKLLLLSIISFLGIINIVSADSIIFGGDKEFTGSEFIIDVLVNSDETKDSNIKVSLVRMFDVKIDDSYSLKNHPAKIKNISVIKRGDYTNVEYDKHLLVYVGDFAKEKAHPGKVVSLYFEVSDEFKVGDELKISFSDGEIISSDQSDGSKTGTSSTVNGSEFIIKKVEEEITQPPTEDDKNDNESDDDNNTETDDENKTPIEDDKNNNESDDDNNTDTDDGNTSDKDEENADKDTSDDKNDSDENKTPIEDDKNNNESDDNKTNNSKDEAEKYICKEDSGKYYVDGAVVDQKTYESYCGVKKAPETGDPIPYAMIVAGLFALVCLKFNAKSQNKIFKL